MVVAMVVAAVVAVVVAVAETGGCGVWVGSWGGLSVPRPAKWVAGSGADAGSGIAKTGAGFSAPALAARILVVAVAVVVVVVVVVVATGARAARWGDWGIGVKRPTSGSPSIPPPRPAKRGEGWGEGPCQAGPLIPTFSPADRGEGVTALSVRPRLVPMSLAGPLRRPGRFSSAGLTT